MVRNVQINQRILTEGNEDDQSVLDRIKFTDHDKTDIRRMVVQEFDRKGSNVGKAVAIVKAKIIAVF